MRLPKNYPVQTVTSYLRTEALRSSTHPPFFPNIQKSVTPSLNLSIPFRHKPPNAQRLSLFEPRLKMAANLLSKRKATEFDDVPLYSDSVSTDGSYDFAENTSDDGEVVAKEKALPRHSLIILTVAIGSSVDVSMGDEKEKETINWLEMSQMMSGDSDVSSVASNDSMPSLVAVSIDENGLKSRLEEAGLAIDEKNKTIQKLMHDDAEYMALLEKQHQEEVAKRETLKKEHEQNVKIIKAKYDATIFEKDKYRQKRISELKQEHDKEIKAAVDHLKRLVGCQEKQIRTVQDDCNAIIAKKDEELTNYQKAASEVQQRYEDLLAALTKKHESETDQILDDFQPGFADMIQKQQAANFQVVAMRKKVEYLTRKMGQDPQQQPPQPTTNHVADLISFASQADDEEMAQCEADNELLPVSRINEKRSHKAQVNDADIIIERVQKQKEQLKASEARVAELEEILNNAQRVIVIKEEEFKAEFEERNAREEASKKDAESAKATIAKLEKDLRRVEGVNFNMTFESMELETKLKQNDVIIDTAAEFLERLDDLREIGRAHV